MAFQSQRGFICCVLLKRVDFIIIIIIMIIIVIIIILICFYVEAVFKCSYLHPGLRTRMDQNSQVMGEAAQ